MKRRSLVLACCGLAAAGWVMVGVPAPAQERAAEAPSQPAAEESRSRGVMEEMDERIEAQPLVEPTQRPGAGVAPGGRSAVPLLHVEVDPAVVGVAPGAKVPPLRREGEFIINRAGRLMRSPSGAQLLFVFEADSQATPEPPMVLLPCQYLQSMEELVQERGDRVRFILSGQITTYRGANYVLPTMWKTDIDRGNLQR